MNAAEALRRLESAGTAQNRKIYARHGVKGAMYGVSFADLGKLAKAIGMDQPLAAALWESGNHDARMLATRIADPAGMTPRNLHDWAGDLDNYILTDALSVLVAQSPGARDIMASWMDSAGEWTRSAGWTVASLLAMHDQEIPDDDWLELLGRIDAEIRGAPNRVRHAMNQALIAIGIRSKPLTDAALAAAGRIGKVEVDHGETGCVTPDAASYIRKTLDHRVRKGARTRAVR